jgi:hypothetical protein
LVLLSYKLLWVPILLENYYHEQDGVYIFASPSV